MIRYARLRHAPAWLPLLAVGLAGCHGTGAAKHGRPPTPVQVAPATRIDAPVTLLASGVVEPVQTVAVTTQVSGTLLQVAFEEGQDVRAGQVLFRIDPRPLETAVEQARANLVRDRAQAVAGARDDARYAELARLGYVARSQADQIHATAVAQAATVRADEAVLRGALLNLSYATIRAPIAGRSGSLLVRRGDVVSPGTGALVIINQIQPARVRFPVLQQDFQALRAAVATHPLDVTAVPTDSSRAFEAGKLSFLDNAVDSLTGTITGKALFPNYATRLWPGELVMLTVDVNVLHGVLAVPTSAVQLGQQGSYVFVVEHGVAQLRPIVPGLATGEYTVVNSGLIPGELVVVDGQSRLNPGARVAIVPSRGAGPREVAGAGGGPAGAALNGTPTAARAGGAGSAAGPAAAALGYPAASASGASRGGAGGSTAPGAVSAGNVQGAAGALGAGGAAGGARGGAATAGTATPIGPSTPAPSTAGAAAAAGATTMPAPGVPAPSPTPPPSTRAPTAGGGASTPTTGGGARTPTGAGGTGARGAGSPAGTGAPAGSPSPAPAGPGHE